MVVTKDVKAFIAIVFLLLGALFGMVIMGFVFGNLIQSTSTLFDPQANTINNESGGFINDSGYTLSNSTEPGFASPVIVSAFNATGLIIDAANYTVSSAGVVTNLTGEGGLFNDVNFSYTFNSNTVAQILTESVGNNSLLAIETYSEQADTQLNTAGIAIVLLILIALFAIFWKFFIGTGKGGGSGGGGSGVMGGGRSSGRRTVASGRGNFG